MQDLSELVPVTDRISMLTQSTVYPYHSVSTLSIFNYYVRPQIATHGITYSLLRHKLECDFGINGTEWGRHLASTRWLLTAVVTLSLKAWRGSHFDLHIAYLLNSMRGTIYYCWIYKFKTWRGHRLDLSSRLLFVQNCFMFTCSNSPLLLGKQMEQTNLCISSAEDEQNSQLNCRLYRRSLFKTASPAPRPLNRSLGVRVWLIPTLYRHSCLLLDRVTNYPDFLDLESGVYHLSL